MLKSDVKREGIKNFISWCEEYIDKLENGNKEGSKEGVQPLKGGDVASIVEPHMETKKEKKPKKYENSHQKLLKEKSRPPKEAVGYL